MRRVGTILRKVTVLATLLLISGCSTYTATALSVGGGLEDDLLDAAVAVKCKAASVGAIMRRYGNNFSVWSNECLKTPELP